MFCVGKHALAAAPLDEGCDEVALSLLGVGGRDVRLVTACSKGLTQAAPVPPAVDIRTTTARGQGRRSRTPPSATWPPSRTISASRLVPTGARLSSVRVPAVPGSQRGRCHGHSPVSLAFLRTHRVAALMAEHIGGCADSSRCVLPLRVRGRDSRGLPPAHRHLLAELGR